MLTRLLKQQFSVYSNQAQQLAEVINGREIKYDYLIHEYDQCIQAYLLRRRIEKDEVPPKMYIAKALDNVDLSSQKLVPLKELYDIDRMKRLHEKGELNAQYLISKLHENHFKQLMDEYTAKLPINGYVVPLAQQDQYEKLKEQIQSLYRTFFFGEQQTHFERDTELRYLIEKSAKQSRYESKQAVRFKCLWTLSNQRRQEMMKNYRGRSLILYDDFRPIYERLLLDEKTSIDTMTRSIVKSDAFSLQSVIARFISSIVEKGLFSKASRRRCEAATSVLLIRTILYTSSIEFTNLLSIPADFHIEHAILNMHIWLLTERLNELNTPSTRFMAKQLLVQLKKNQLQSISRIHLKKKNDFIKDIIHYMQANRSAFQTHIYANPFKLDPINNPESIYYQLDALLWSTVFFEKVPRYSDEVYMMAEYFKQQRDYLKTCSVKDFEDALIEFDAYRVQSDFVRVVQQHSPRLSEAEFNREFHSEKPMKKYYYNYKGGSEDSSAKSNELPINTEEGLNTSFYTNIRGFDQSLNKTLFKFQTLKTYDYMNDLEKQQQETKKNTKKYAFSESPEKQALQDIENLDPDQIKKIRYQREQAAAAAAQSKASESKKQDQ